VDFVHNLAVCTACPQRMVAEVLLDIPVERALILFSHKHVICPFLPYLPRDILPAPYCFDYHYLSLYVHRSQQLRGIAVLLLDLPSTITSPKQNPSLSTALAMWLAFRPARPLPPWVLPSSATIFLSVPPVPPEIPSFYLLWNSFRYQVKP